MLRTINDAAIASTAPVLGAEPSAALTQAAILDQLAESVVVTDAAGLITLVNAAAARMHGVARLDVPPDEYSDTYHLYTESGDPYPPSELPLARAVRGETVSEARFRVRRPDGTEVLVIGDARPLRDAEGRQIGAVLTARDDTARDAAEQALRRLNDGLIATVQTRTADAETARCQAERASAAKSDFLACMSHELRTPLTAILGYAEVLGGDPELSCASRDHAERIRSAGSTLLALVNDVLDFSAADAGRLRLHPRRTDLRILLETSVDLVRPQAQQSGLVIKLEHETCHAPVMVDSGRLQQVLVNLLGNAVKFTPHGEVTSSLHCEIYGRMVKVKLAVSDTGVGIAADQLGTIFHQFEQGDVSTSRRFGGTGLGLAISQKIISEMGGRLGVESAPDVGSVFTVRLTLPLADEEAKAPVLRPPTGKSRSGLRVLLAEDVALNRDLVALFLKPSGVELHMAVNGEAAVQAAQTCAFDVILMDMQMPVMDGLEATRRIRAGSGASANARIVALSANVLPADLERCRAAGMDDHLGKPLTATALLQKLVIEAS